MANISRSAGGASRRGGRWAAAAALVVAAGCAVGASGVGATTLGPTSSGFGSNWTVYHGNYLSTGVDPAGTDLSPLRRAWRSPTLDGSLFGEPLVYGGRVVIATTNDTIYELSAHNGAILWHRHYATPVPTRDLACAGDVDPTVGITGTPVIDPSRSEIFAVADERAANGSISDHLLGVNLVTGNVELNEVADVPGRPPKAELQRPGLTLDRGQVIIGYGGNDGDCGNYTGAIVAVPEGGGPDRVYTVEPTASDREGAVWQGGGSPLVDSSGNIWFSTGNGSAETGDPYDYSDSVTELSPTLAREQYFAPSTWASDNANDEDLGSAAPAFVDGYVFQVGKLHVAYLLNPAHLGGIGGAGGGVVRLDTGLQRRSAQRAGGAGRHRLRRLLRRHLGGRHQHGFAAHARALDEQQRLERRPDHRQRARLVDRRRERHRHPLRHQPCEREPGRVGVHERRGHPLPDAHGGRRPAARAGARRRLRVQGSGRAAAGAERLRHHVGLTDNGQDGVEGQHPYVHLYSRRWRNQRGRGGDRRTVWLVFSFYDTQRPRIRHLHLWHGPRLGLDRRRQRAHTGVDEELQGHVRVEGWARTWGDCPERRRQRHLQDL